MKIFNGEMISPAWTSKEALLEFTLTTKAQNKEKGEVESRNTTSKRKWTKLMVQQLKVTTNWAWRSTTKEAGSGYIVRDCNGKVLIYVVASDQSLLALYLELLAIKNVMSYIYSNQEINEPKIVIESRDDNLT